VSTKQWRLVVTSLSGSTPLHELQVEAGNWMGALRDARKAIGEDGGLPPGASCAVAPDGTVTILDAAARRKLVLTPTRGAVPPGVQPTASSSAAASTSSAQQAARAQPQSPGSTANAPSAASTSAAAANTPTAAQPSPAKKAKFQTVAYTPGMDVPVPTTMGAKPAAPAAVAPPAAAIPTPAAPSPQAPKAASVPGTPASTFSAKPQAPAPVTAAPARVESSSSPSGAPTPKKRFETVAFLPNAQAAERPAVSIPVGQAAATPAARPAVTPAAPTPEPPTSTVSKPPSGSSTPVAAPAYKSGTSFALEVQLTRDEEPSPQNPLTYRERAYLIPRGMSVMETEAALRFRLSDLQRQMEQAPRGKLVHLAAFDHRWTGAPERPPLVVLEWRDWRGEPAVDYPAAARSSSSLPPDGDPATEERLSAAFEALHELAQLRTAAEGLDFAVRLLEDFVPSMAISACLYDINTDQLRFVALSGPGKSERQGAAVSRSLGLLGQAARAEQMSLVIPDVRVQPGYNADVDGRAGMFVDNMLLRSIVHEGQLLGVLQLINRESGAFQAGDVHVVSYVADGLARFLFEMRSRRRA
jgi:hypothetical protein